MQEASCDMPVRSWIAPLSRENSQGLAYEDMMEEHLPIEEMQQWSGYSDHRMGFARMTSFSDAERLVN